MAVTAWVLINTHLQVRQKLGHILNFIKNDWLAGKPDQKARRVHCSKVSFKWIVETDVVNLRAHFMLEECCFARLARSCDQDGRKASKGLVQGGCELALLVPISQ